MSNTPAGGANWNYGPYDPNNHGGLGSTTAPGKPPAGAGLAGVAGGANAGSGAASGVNMGAPGGGLSPSDPAYGHTTVGGQPATGGAHYDPLTDSYQSGGTPYGQANAIANQLATQGAGFQGRPGTNLRNEGNGMQLAYDQAAVGDARARTQQGVELLAGAAAGGAPSGAAMRTGAGLSAGVGDAFAAAHGRGGPVAGMHGLAGASGQVIGAGADARGAEMTRAQDAYSGGAGALRSGDLSQQGLEQQFGIQQAQLDAAQRAQNDKMQTQWQGMGVDLLGHQLQADTSMSNTDQGNAAQLGAQNYTQNQNYTRDLYGAGMGAAAGGLSYAAQMPSGAPAGPSQPYSENPDVVSSDENAKTGIQPAGGSFHNPYAQGPGSSAPTTAYGAPSAYNANNGFGGRGSQGAVDIANGLSAQGAGYQGRAGAVATNGYVDQARANSLADAGAQASALNGLYDTANGRGAAIDATRAVGAAGLAQGQSQQAAIAHSVGGSAGVAAARAAANQGAAMQTTAGNATNAAIADQQAAARTAYTQGASALTAQNQQQQAHEQGLAYAQGQLNQGQSAENDAMQGAYQGMANQVTSDQMAADASGYNSQQNANQQMAAAQSASGSALRGQLTGAGIGMGMALLSDITQKQNVASDITGKTNVASDARTKQTIAGGAGGLARHAISEGTKASPVSSDARGKELRPGGASLADHFMDHLTPFSYEYKNPANEPSSKKDGGRYLGVMAQDVEKAPVVGRQIVTDTPRGKVLEGGALMSGLAAASGRLNERTSALEDIVAELAAKKARA